ncbi:hypothetical protein GCM10010452_31440 [Crossiella cryophila]
MATAGSPATARPWAARRISSVPKSPASGQSSPIATAVTSAPIITGRLPTASDSMASGSTPTASARVARVTESAASASVSRKPVASTGSTDWGA